MATKPRLSFAEALGLICEARRVADALEAEAWQDVDRYGPLLYVFPIDEREAEIRRRHGEGQARPRRRFHWR